MGGEDRHYGVSARAGTGPDLRSDECSAQRNRRQLHPRQSQWSYHREQAYGFYSGTSPDADQSEYRRHRTQHKCGLGQNALRVNAAASTVDNFSAGPSPQLAKERAKVLRKELGRGARARGSGEGLALLHRGADTSRHPTEAPEVGVGAVSLAPKQPAAPTKRTLEGSRGSCLPPWSPCSSLRSRSVRRGLLCGRSCP